MDHIIKINSADWMLVVDALDIMKKDADIHPEDRIKARELSNLIIDTVFNDIRERGKDGCKDIPREGEQD